MILLAPAGRPPTGLSPDSTPSLARMLDAVLSRSPAQPLFQWRAASRLLVLAYHEVGDADAFAAQMDHLRARATPVSLERVLRAIRTRGELPPRAVLVTFDDADPSVHARALPVLRERGIPAVVFAVAGHVGTRTPFWWREVEELLARGVSPAGLPAEPDSCVAALKRLPDEERLDAIERLRARAGGPPVRMRQLTAGELRELEAGGVAVENHTLTHPCLDRCSPDVVEREILVAHERLTGVLGRAPRAFAYPNGNWDPRAAALLRRLGYGAAFLFDHRLAAFPPADPHRISRVRVSWATPPDRFRILVSGLHPALHRLMGRR